MCLPLIFTSIAKGVGHFIDQFRFNSNVAFPMMDLPEELNQKIFSFCQTKERQALLSTNYTWFRIAVIQTELEYIDKIECIIKEIICHLQTFHNKYSTELIRLQSIVGREKIGECLGDIIYAYHWNLTSQKNSKNLNEKLRCLALFRNPKLLAIDQCILNRVVTPILMNVPLADIQTSVESPYQHDFQALIEAIKYRHRIEATPDGLEFYNYVINLINQGNGNYVIDMARRKKIDLSRLAEAVSQCMNPCHYGDRDLELKLLIPFNTSGTDAGVWLASHINRQKKKDIALYNIANRIFSKFEENISHRPYAPSSMKQLGEIAYLIKDKQKINAIFQSLNEICYPPNLASLLRIRRPPAIPLLW